MTSKLPAFEVNYIPMNLANNRLKHEPDHTGMAESTSEEVAITYASQ